MRWVVVVVVELCSLRGRGWRSITVHVLSVHNGKLVFLLMRIFWILPPSPISDEPSLLVGFDIGVLDFFDFFFSPLRIRDRDGTFGRILYLLTVRTVSADRIG
ncbi:hypothetical protein BDQ94DRAFT_152338 [Aspergillus welwitschiae]|uniref:Uncharacterized protein n=1 Tax=Aspergillus welwitschiae TaxID=1341132 RepID=A0A3F3PN09_9EURO|nr:hypothetical protein BDQ94DRAFT_152338 [Aspergillus welwitschiae]RDH28223.1 hypothetical protein BDQ94DRAFT_152338 [Aspergillus welwitschiae]